MILKNRNDTLYLYHQAHRSVRRILPLLTQRASIIGFPWDTGAKGKRVRRAGEEGERAGYHFPGSEWIITQLSEPQDGARRQSWVAFSFSCWPLCRCCQAGRETKVVNNLLIPHCDDLVCLGFESWSEGSSVSVTWPLNLRPPRRCCDDVSYPHQSPKCQLCPLGRRTHALLVSAEGPRGCCCLSCLRGSVEMPLPENPVVTPQTEVAGGGVQKISITLIFKMNKPSVMHTQGTQACLMMQANTFMSAIYQSHLTTIVDFI
ncbi:uncharacterized protein LOC104877001 [Fukomys damarensis]|uniref:uncharacterized protein LOC104877001 n=1 Tax=Fukomys damarensis TaxID=885580 RepID=UPI001455AF4E|nr:uncharacterized protein LOC104877001 [Fukomys damarensis]